MLKKYYAITLLFQAASLIKAETPPVESPALSHVIEDKKSATTQTKTSTVSSVEAIQADKDFCLKTIADENADIHALSPSGKTSLQLLTLYWINNFKTEQLLAQALKRGADANVRDEQGRTPLFFITAYALCPEVFAEKQAALDKEIAETKAAEITKSPKISDADKAIDHENSVQTRNPLHDRTLSLAVLELLLAFNADPTVTDQDNNSPLLLAIQMDDQEVIELFSRYGLMERIFKASADGSSNITEFTITETLSIEEATTA